MKAKKIIIENKIDVDSTFYELKNIPYLEEPIKFLESLNLTYEQYDILNNIFYEYGRKKYEDGEDNESMRNSDESY